MFVLTILSFIRKYSNVHVTFQISLSYRYFLQSVAMKLSLSKSAEYVAEFKLPPSQWKNVLMVRKELICTY